MRSLERINGDDVIERSETAAWELIVIFALPVCSLPLMVPLGSNEILIAGGTQANNDCLGDGFLFNTEDKRAQKCFEGDSQL